VFRNFFPATKTTQMEPLRTTTRTHHHHHHLSTKEQKRKEKKNKKKKKKELKERRRSEKRRRRKEEAEEANNNERQNSSSKKRRRKEQNINEIEEDLEEEGYEIYEEEEEEEDAEVNEVAVATTITEKTTSKKSNIIKAMTWKSNDLVGQKFGPWQVSEEKLLFNALKAYALKNGHGESLKKDDYSFLLRGKNADRAKSERALFYELSNEVGTRNPQQCYARVRRTLISSAKGAADEGEKWSEEETAKLKNLTNTHGTGMWEQIGAQIGRTGQSCRDKYRHMSVLDSNTRSVVEIKKGKFSPEERENFQKIMNDYYKENDLMLGGGIKADALDDESALVKRRECLENVSWKEISKKMGNRTDKACFAHYKNILASQAGDYMVENGLWSAGGTEDLLLLEQVKRQLKTLEKELDWDLVVVPNKSLKLIKRRWKYIKSRVLTKNEKTLEAKVAKYEKWVQKIQEFVL
jgi:hypothetical protein